MKKILIVGKNSFVGDAVFHWLTTMHENAYTIDIVDAIQDAWKNADFSAYDVVYQVAGIAHVKKETPEMEELFYKVNAEMTGEIAAAAKKAGVKQYIFMSTKGVYASFVPVIDENTPTNPPKLYGKSKLAGEDKLRALEDDHFKVSILRIPSIYGKGAPGSYYELLKRTDSLMVFPAYKNRRSLIYIDNFCEFIHIVIDRGLSGVLVAQDAEYVSTSDIVRYAAKYKGKKILFDYISWPIIALLVRWTKKFRKPFGSTVFKKNFSINDRDYYVCDLETAVRKSVES